MTIHESSVKKKSHTNHAQVLLQAILFTIKINLQDNQNYEYIPFN